MNVLSGFFQMNANLTSLDFQFDNGPVTGKLILTPTVGSF